MDPIKPTAWIKNSGYENVEADCPICRQGCIFNRKWDLCTSGPIAGIDVVCEKCKKGFRLVGDTLNEQHEMLIFDCHEHLERKRYRNCILNLCQAYEMFFSLYLRVTLVYKPFGSDSDSISADLCLNQLFQTLEQKIKPFSFEKMRACFLRLIIDSNPPSTLDEARNYMKKLDPRPPKDDELKAVTDTTLVGFLMRIKSVAINELRNKVVHQAGYRPKRDEAEKALQETRSILFPLTWRLNLQDDVNLYLLP